MIFDMSPNPMSVIELNIIHAVEFELDLGYLHSLAFFKIFIINNSLFRKKIRLIFNDLNFILTISFHIYLKKKKIDSNKIFNNKQLPDQTILTIPLHYIASINYQVLKLLSTATDQS
ncbi:hypothetical protein BpHYR1_000017 [Brachionus plicatilis]|uniref:Uncharacterized protein n=1 Tax=Brachionus plicatilis TaxID=10195 RepID=A0A3M7RXJ9_BRAPC|nr:hypothetical protein BpHYR1_000017 [Brachionus plicatilis]